MTTFSNYGQVNDRRQAEIIRSLGFEKPDLDRETALAGLQELLRPGVIQAFSEAFAPAEFRDAAFRPSSTMRIFYSAEYCLRVARRMSFTIRSEDILGVPDF
jgi:hypothetical protein